MGVLEGKVALITGGGGGIGSATARVFAAEGAWVAVADLRQDAANQVAGQLTEQGARACSLALDVTDEAAVSNAVRTVIELWGRLDILINNAGMALQGCVVDTELADWNRVLAVNLTGTWLMTKHCAPAMSGAASIVNIASVAALMAVREAGAYTAAKGGVVALTRVAAAELAPDIRVNCICPGTVLTAMPEEMLRNRGRGSVEAGAALTAQKYLVGRLGEAEEIAQSALFLASPQSSFVTGAVLVADGGVTAQ